MPHVVAEKQKLDPADQGMKHQHEELLKQLVGRQNCSVNQMIYVGDSCAEHRLTQLARDQYDRILKRADEDSSFLPPAAATRIRAQLIGLLRDEKRYDEALRQLDLLLKKVMKFHKIFIYFRSFGSGQVITGRFKSRSNGNN